jgi:hypothetical protein
MHYRMLITLAVIGGESSLDARTRAYDHLLSEPGFAGESSRFNSPIADWFVIGGRWSGFLSETSIGEAYRARLKERFPQVTGAFYFSKDVEPHREAIDALWRECGGQGTAPFYRCPYDDLGQVDDALILDQTLYDALLIDYAGASEYREGGHCYYADLDGEPLGPSFISRKWLIVIDYHN